MATVRIAAHASPSPTISSPALLIGSAAALAALSALFVAYPRLDLEIAAAFYQGPRSFAGDIAPVEAVRNLLKAVYVGVLVLALVGGVAAARSMKAWGGLSAPKWLFLVACLSVGPGLVANVVFKDQWGRARPKQVTMYGGAKAYTPSLVPSDQCDQNCSFVSGEASSHFALFFALALLVRRRSAMLVAAGLAAGTVTGAIRMSQGAHFLSDIAFAGALMGLTVAALHVLLDRETTMARQRPGPGLWDVTAWPLAPARRDQA